MGLGIGAGREAQDGTWALPLFWETGGHEMLICLIVSGLD